MRFGRFPILVALLFMVSLVSVPMFGQSLTQGAIAGTVFDPSHAVVANVTVSLKSLDTGSTASTTTSDTGAYRFNLLKPGHYQISVKQTGFAESVRPVDVQVGNTTTADVDLTVSKGTETIEVSGVAPLVVLDPSSNTSYTQQEVHNLPSAGGDITNIAQTSPGAVRTRKAAMAISL